MSSDPTPLARRAGTLYFVMALLMIAGYMYLPTLYYVPGDPAATAARMVERPFVFRLSIANALAAQLLFIFVATTLYHLFRDVDRYVAVIMLATVSVGIAAELAVIGLKMASLSILSGDRYWSTFPRPQLETLSFGFLRFSGNMGRVLGSIWGLWLFPFGLLVVRSGYFPRVLGYLLFAAGIGYVATCVTFILFPDQLAIVNRFATPLYFGEVPIILWMMIVGARTRASANALAPA